ncbi:MAG: cell surface protein [Opitutales bacterium]|nr:cell surface protein [Opitutales bacterium]
MMKNAKLSVHFLFLALVFLLTGCQTVFRDLTRERIPENPSGIYTFEFAAQLSNTNVVPGSERAKIVINGETFDMEPSPSGDRIFQFDYRMPQGVTEARYYYILTYDYVSNNVRRSAERFSTHEAGGVYRARLVNRYTIQLVADRGPVGSAIALVGSGFRSGDTVVIGDREADTTVQSGNSIEFTVPGLEAGRSYPVVLRTSGGDIDVGNFRVDEGSLSVTPTSLRIRSGEVAQVIFQIPNPAPSGGYHIDVTTDAPASVIMDEVVIPAGFNSVVVDVEGGEPGSGSLFVEAPGFATRNISLRVD